MSASHAHFPLEAWADRNPRVRWPLVYLLLLLLWGLGGWIAPADF